MRMHAINQHPLTRRFAPRLAHLSCNGDIKDAQEYLNDMLMSKDTFAAPSKGVHEPVLDIGLTMTDTSTVGTNDSLTSEDEILAVMMNEKDKIINGLNEKIEALASHEPEVPNKVKTPPPRLRLLLLFALGITLGSFIPPPLHSPITPPTSFPSPTSSHPNVRSVLYPRIPPSSLPSVKSECRKERRIIKEQEKEISAMSPLQGKSNGRGGRFGGFLRRNKGVRFMVETIVIGVVLKGVPGIGKVIVGIIKG